MLLAAVEVVSDADGPLCEHAARPTGRATVRYGQDEPEKRHGVCSAIFGAWCSPGGVWHVVVRENRGRPSAESPCRAQPVTGIGAGVTGLGGAGVTGVGAARLPG